VQAGVCPQRTYYLNTGASLSPFTLVNLQAGFSVLVPLKASRTAGE
jgi:hypothetical protein